MKPDTTDLPAPGQDLPVLHLANHPCFDPQARHRYGRVHLPVAPRCNLQCNFCNRKYDCVNESRPGVTSVILTPEQALAYVTDLVAQRPEIAVVGIAGPGDPFANPEETLRTLRLVRARFPALLLCVATNGLGVGPYIEELAALRVSHVTITVCAVDPAIGEKIYAWVREDKHPLRGQAGAARLIACQLDAIQRLQAHGITVKINAIIVPGINDRHVSEIAGEVSRRGASLMNCVPLYPVQGAEFEALPAPDAAMVARVRLQCSRLLPQMSHCARCRADAAGLIGEPTGAVQIHQLQHYAALNPQAEPDQLRPFVAVASLEGALVNQHLGEADRVLIYGPDATSPGAFELREIRRAPAAGGGDTRWQALGETLRDCRALLVSAAGPTPLKALTATGLNVIEMEGLIEEGLRAVYANQPIPASLKRRFNGCGAGLTCKGTGTGCG